MPKKIFDLITDYNSSSNPVTRWAIRAIINDRLLRGKVDKIYKLPWAKAIKNS